MSRIFIGIDGQVDFINGALSNPDAQNNVAVLNQAHEDARAKGFDINWTLDTHIDDYYLDTLEGKTLPIKHTIKGTPGWELHPALKAEADDSYFEKPTFGSIEMLNSMMVDDDIEPIEIIVMGGYCTDICGVSNALLLRAGLPNTRIVWLAFASAGTTPENHNAALAVMESCQIEVLHSYAEYEHLLDSLA